ncbi:MAG: helix-turn-helix domain-containing protein [Bacteroidota bacterium]
MIESASIFILVGVSLGLFFTLLLTTSFIYQSRSNQLLAATLFIFILLLLRVSALAEGTLLAEFMDCIRVEYLFSALFYCYLCSSLEEPLHPQISLLLFSPFFLLSSWYSIIILREDRIDPRLEVGMEYFELFEVYLVGLFFFVVIALAPGMIKRSKSPATLKRWISIKSCALAVLVSGWLLLDGVERLFDLDYWDYLVNGMALFLIGITYFGVQHLPISSKVNPIQVLPKEEKKSVLPSLSKVSIQHFKRMQQLMLEQQIFKDPAFNRQRLASSLGLSPGTITRVLKENTTLNFNEFVDQYRIDLAKRLLLDERFQIYSLEAVGKEVGFKSRSHFYATFKKVTGLTPGAYKKRQILSCTLSNPLSQDSH